MWDKISIFYEKHSRVAACMRGANDKEYKFMRGRGRDP